MIINYSDAGESLKLQSSENKSLQNSKLAKLIFLLQHSHSVLDIIVWAQIKKKSDENWGNKIVLPSNIHSTSSFNLDLQPELYILRGCSQTSRFL